MARLGRHRRGATASRSLVADTRSLSRLLVVFVSLSLLATVTVGTLLLRASNETRTLVAATRDARLAHEALLDQQIGVRGFLLSGQTRYLEPYDQGRSVISELHRSIAVHIASDAHLVLLLIDAELAADRWMA